MKILLTGQRGFFGQHLTKRLKENNYDSLFGLGDTKDLDLKLEDRVKLSLNHIKPDVIVHLAANPRGNADISAMDDNCKATLNLVHHAPEGCHFIFASSIVLYGDYHYLTFLEDMTPKPTSLYAVSKLNAENIINRYERIGKIKKTNLRFSALVGDGLTHGFIFDLVNKIKSNSTELELIGNAPGSIKPFLHIEDACNSIIFAIEKELTGTYNVCPQDNISVEDVAKIAMDKLGKEKSIKWNESQVWQGDNRELKAGNCKLFSAGFDFKYKTSRKAIEAYFDELIK